MFEPVKADRLLHDKDIVELGGTRIEVFHHPGHTKGACSYLLTVKDSARSYRVLIVNMPSILSETRFPGMPTYPEVGRDYAYTLSEMPKMQFDIWLSSHASQFDLQKKHQPGEGYHPEAFFDRPAYDSSIEKLQQTYRQRSQVN
jgi:metallo-beta-lactamase class B